jgi:hypothetical protein
MHYCQGTSASCRPKTTGLVSRWLLAVLVGLAATAAVPVPAQTPGPVVEGAPDGAEASYLRREVTVPMER